MRRRTLLPTLAALACGASLPARAEDGVAVIGHAGLRGLDAATVTRIYTGRTIEVNGVAVTAINAVPGSPVRNRFLREVLSQDEEKYTAYWTVRRYIGKGASPREIGRASDVIAFVSSTPGGIGYIELADLRPGLNVLLRIPP